MSFRLIESLFFILSLLIVFSYFTPAYLRTLYRIGSNAGLQEFIVDLCLVHENPGTIIERSYDLPEIELFDGGVRGVHIWLFPSCGIVEDSVIRLPLNINKTTRISGINRLRLYSMFGNGTVNVEILPP